MNPEQTLLPPWSVDRPGALVMALGGCRKQELSPTIKLGHFVHFPCKLHTELSRAVG